MDMKKFGGRISRLAELAEGWETHGTTDPMERDIALELLRGLYMELRFPETGGAQCSVHETIPEPAACGLPLHAAEPEKEPDGSAEKEPVQGKDAGSGLPDPEPAPEKESIPVVPRRVDPGVIRSLYGDSPAQAEPPHEPATEREIPKEPVKKSPQPATIADTMNGTRQTLGETLQNGKKDMASKIAASERPELKRAIGLNDKFLMIRDMFDGDAVAFETVIAHLDTFTDLDEAVIYIHETYNWNADSDGVKLLIELLERKLG